MDVFGREDWIAISSGVLLVLSVVVLVLSVWLPVLSVPADYLAFLLSASIENLCLLIAWVIGMKEFYSRNPPNADPPLTLMPNFYLGSVILVALSFVPVVIMALLPRLGHFVGVWRMFLFIPVFTCVYGLVLASVVLLTSRH